MHEERAFVGSAEEACPYFESEKPLKPPLIRFLGSGGVTTCASCGINYEPKVRYAAVSMT